ncbi:mechanosensitive ion channel family protein [Oculatella sp. FACHB-28]|uniref:mechanosensitive ion channel domain-containing protein n=1 Tax=Oculatella sp. FACHB-28 TaxID=2692845 RepID=UPI00168802FF|nr:mechanosensitive ion channel family protein [Oculatella sp. FACHB-28]
MSELVQTINSSLLRLVAQAVEFLPSFILAIAILIITRYAVRPIRAITQTATDKVVKSPSLRSLILQIAYVTTWIAGILLACVIAFPDLGLGDIIGLLGLGSVAIGFAFQDIFKNFLAGVLLLLNEPFRLNDQIVVNDYEGTVEQINIRSIEIRTYQGERVVIPNATVFTSSIRVLTDRPYRRTDLAIGLDYNTPLPRAVQVLLMALTDVEGVLSNPSAEVDVVSFGDSSIDFVVRYWTLPQKLHVRQTQTRVMMALKEACDQANFSIPYPIRSVYLFDQQFNDSVPTASSTTPN